MLELAGAPDALLAEMTIPEASIQSRVQCSLFSVAMPAFSSEKEKPNNKKGYF